MDNRDAAAAETRAEASVGQEADDHGPVAGATGDEHAVLRVERSIGDFGIHAAAELGSSPRLVSFPAGTIRPLAWIKRARASPMCPPMPLSTIWVSRPEATMPSPPQEWARRPFIRRSPTNRPATPPP